MKFFMHFLAVQGNAVEVRYGLITLYQKEVWGKETLAGVMRK